MTHHTPATPNHTRSGQTLAQGSGMGGGIVPGVFPQAESMRPTIYGERWAVVAGHPLVSDAAADILRRGGNAIDAGVAAGFASNVVQVDMCNLGGIAPILVSPAGSPTVEAIAGIGVWGADADLEHIRQRYGGALPLGGAPSIVPGAVSGWLTALARHGTMSVGEVLEAASSFATDGVVLDPRTAAHLATMAGSLSGWESSAAIFQPGGAPLQEGDRLRQPALARTLRRLADAATRAERAGAGREEAIEAAHAEFYRSDIAETIADFVVAHGGFLAPSDLAGFRA
ncbi:gamma-glutamyltransferase, partial [Microbacterium sp.]|uniref:gamma-glutamyltransferase n=1 Tax=Microbacterium sp. TaxID=51671 RepID=UPI003A863AB8